MEYESCRKSELPLYKMQLIFSIVFLKKMESLIALSGRMEDSREYTEGWFTENYGDIFDWVLLTNHDTPKQVPKYKLARKYGIWLMIEDNAQYVTDLIIHCIPTLLIEAPWNIDMSLYPDIYRLKNRWEIVDLIKV